MCLRYCKKIIIWHLNPQVDRRPKLYAQFFEDNKFTNSRDVLKTSLYRHITSDYGHLFTSKYL